MPLTIDQLEEKLLSLSETSRVRIATTLLQSLPVPDGVLEEGTPEFEIEMARRCKEIDEGTVEFIPYETVMHELDLLLQKG